MIVIEAVTYSDRIVLAFLKSKAPEGSEFSLRHSEVVAETGIPYMTVRRALCRLHRSGLIYRHYNLGESYTYKVLHGNSSPNR